MQSLNSPFGPYLPKKFWVPAPRYALRRASIMDAMAASEPGELLEIGCGAGALLAEFAERGFAVTGVEMSSEGRQRAEMFAANVPGMTILEHPGENWSEKFSYLFSFEVLEHIEDDVAALTEWTKWLRPGGKVLVSVPAHMKLWAASDEFAGHFRRYSRQQVEQLLLKAGLTEISVEIYGFPISNLVEPVRNAYHNKRLKRGANQRDMKTATENSGVDRDLEARLFPLMTHFPGRQIFQLGVQVQKIFRNTELGTGWLASARKPVT